MSLTLEQRRELERAAAVARAALGEEAFRVAVAGGAAAAPDRLTAEALAWVQSLPPPGPPARAPGAPGTTAPPLLAHPAASRPARSRCCA